MQWCSHLQFPTVQRENNPCTIKHSKSHFLHNSAAQSHVGFSALWWVNTQLLIMLPGHTHSYSSSLSSGTFVSLFSVLLSSLTKETVLRKRWPSRMFHFSSNSRLSILARWPLHGIVSAVLSGSLQQMSHLQEVNNLHVDIYIRPHEQTVCPWQLLTNVSILRCRQNFLGTEPSQGYCKAMELRLLRTLPFLGDNSFSAVWQ